MNREGIQSIVPGPRPRGDFTTVIDIAPRNDQDNYFFPLGSEKSWFHRDPFTVYPSTMANQEIIHKGAASWGGRLTFELGSLVCGDLLQCLLLQIRLGSWYDPTVLLNLSTANYTVDLSSNPWTYINSLGTSIIEYAEFEVGDQTLERIDGEFIKTYAAMMPDENTIFGVATDGTGTTNPYNVANNTQSMNPNRPWPTQNGVYFCLLPFFFMRTRFKQVFPLLSCTEGTVRVHVQLRPFDQCVRSTTGARTSCTETPLGSTVTFNSGAVSYTVPSIIPAFQDFRILTYSALVDGKARHAYIQKPFEQMNKFVTRFHFDEPYQYLTSKTNSSKDTVDISLPLELNHPCQELFWVFRRKGVAINNEWASFQPALETQIAVGRIVQPWLTYATLRINGFVLDQAEGEWWRDGIAKAHKGGWNSWASSIYGYSFAREPDEHQPSGSANMSRASSIKLDLRVRVPPAVSVPSGFDGNVAQGWEVIVFAIHLNWLRFENGLCQKLFED